ncbi:hypothetical protein AAFP35_13495 [Gordonia sp. CPCC 206044]|uniref:hypothetical protein n=1 Tax=Gordonia sp. CPCC 206044 TaxID=3140793 RepID=UPI003AF3BF95
MAHHHPAESDFQLRVGAPASGDFQMVPDHDPEVSEAAARAAHRRQILTYGGVTLVLIALLIILVASM